MSHPFAHSFDALDQLQDRRSTNVPMQVALDHLERFDVQGGQIPTAKAVSVDADEVIQLKNAASRLWCVPDKNSLAALVWSRRDRQVSPIGVGFFLVDHIPIVLVIGVTAKSSHLRSCDAQQLNGVMCICCTLALGISN